MDYNNKGLNFSAVLKDYNRRVRSVQIRNGKVVVLKAQ